MTAGSGGVTRRNRRGLLGCVRPESRDDVTPIGGGCGQDLSDSCGSGVKGADAGVPEVVEGGRGSGSLPADLLGAEQPAGKRARPARMPGLGVWFATCSQWWWHWRSQTGEPDPMERRRRRDLVLSSVRQPGEAMRRPKAAAERGGGAQAGLLGAPSHNGMRLAWWSEEMNGSSSPQPQCLDNLSIHVIWRCWMSKSKVPTYLCPQEIGK